MATNRRNVEFIVEQIANAGAVSFKPMFGEYGIYFDAKLVALFNEAAARSVRRAGR